MVAPVPPEPAGLTRSVLPVRPLLLLLLLVRRVLTGGHAALPALVVLPGVQVRLVGAVRGFGHAAEPAASSAAAQAGLAP